MNTLETKDRDPADVESPVVESGDVASPGAAPRDTESPAESTTSPAAESPSQTRYALALTTLVCAVAAVLWISAVARSAGRGFDTSDEGYYLLSYRWWSTHYRNFTGAQYLYGPVFQVLGYSIKGLRLFRLFSMVAVHGALGYTLMRWLRERRPHAPPTRLWEAAGTAAIIATAGVGYGWLPLSPGYNDVSLLGGMLGAAVVLRAGTYAERGVDVPKWVPLSFGPVIVGSLFAKWASSSVSMAAVAVTLAVVLWPRGLREMARFTGWTVASVLATVAVIHVLVVPLSTALPPMIAVNKAVAANTNSVHGLLDLYWTTSKALVTRTGSRYVLLLIAAAVAAVGRPKVVQQGASLLAVAGIAYAYADVDAHHGTMGGNPNLAEYPGPLLAGLVITIVMGLLVVLRGRLPRAAAALRERLATSTTTTKIATASADHGASSSLDRDGLRGWAVLALLAALPVTQALGTGNPLYFMAINGFAAWMAIIVAILTGMEGAPSAARWIATTLAASAILLCSNIGSTGVRLYPYRTVGHDLATDVAGAVPALSSLRLSPTDAASYSHLRWMLRPYVEPPGRPVIAFDEMSGLVLLLDGQPVGETWYSGSDTNRSAAGIVSECAGKPPYWGARSPIIIYRRAVIATEIQALRTCGLNFTTDYRLLAPRQETMGLAVYVPVNEDPKEPK